MYLAAVPQPSTDNHLSHSLITLQHESEPQRLRAIRLRLLTYFHAHDSSIRWPDPERPGHFIHVRQIPGAGGQVQWTQEPLTPSPPTHITHGQSQNETDLSDFRTFWDQRRAERLARSSRSTQSEQIFARLPTTWTAHPSSDPNSLTNDRSLYIADTDGVRCPVHQHLGPHRCEHAPTWASSSLPLQVSFTPPAQTPVMSVSRITNNAPPQPSSIPSSTHPHSLNPYHLLPIRSLPPEPSVLETKTH
jgi:hypothetical protein